MQTRKYIWYWKPQCYDLYTRKKINKLTECNWIHDKLNTNKLTKKLNSHYYPILQECMNIQNGKANFQNSQILLDSGCSSTIVMGRLI